MTHVEQAIFTQLRDFAALDALISDRAYPNVLPEQATLPAVVYSRISATREHNFGNGNPPVATARFQFDCFGSTYLSAVNVGEQVRKALMGLMTSGYDVIIDNDMDDWDPESKRYRRIVDVLITHGES